MHPLLEQLAAALQQVLPQHGLSDLVRWLMRVRVRWVKNALIRGIGGAVGVDFSEARSADPDDYECFNAFFTRELKPGARPLDPDPRALLWPCDGRVSEAGRLDGSRILQAKGIQYTVDALLAGDPAARGLAGGTFFTVYLSPRDYHRVHMPLAGRLTRMIYVPGKLFSVAPYTVRRVPGLFARNERVVCLFETEVGPVAQVLVGAMLVGSMSTAWSGDVLRGHTRETEVTDYPAPGVALARGAEMGRFNMGSTVILVLPPGVVESMPDLPAGSPVRLGRRMATLASHYRRPGPEATTP